MTKHRFCAVTVATLASFAFSQNVYNPASQPASVPGATTMPAGSSGVRPATQPSIAGSQPASQPSSRPSSRPSGPQVPTSNLEPMSLERNSYSTPIIWPNQSGWGGSRLADALRNKDCLEFFCQREIMFHGPELGREMKASSLDAVWGVRFTWPYPARKGEKYVFVLNGPAAQQPSAQQPSVREKYPENLEMPDYVLINGRLYFTRQADSPLQVRIEYIPAADGPMTVSLVKDRFYCMRQLDKFNSPGPTIFTNEVLVRVMLNLNMNLSVSCQHLGRVDQPPTAGADFALPQDLRTFKSPGPWRWSLDQDIVNFDLPPIRKPDYPTDGVTYNQFHDFYLVGGGRRGGNPKVMAMVEPRNIQAYIRMSLDNGINCFISRRDVLDGLEAMGFKDAPITIEYSGGYIKRGMGTTMEQQRASRKAEGTRIADVLRRFPNALVVYRLNEFSGCQWMHVNDIPEERERTSNVPWYEFAPLADEINRQAMDELFAEAREVGGKRFMVAANVQAGYLSSHALHSGADFTLDKTIDRNQINIVVASSRGVNTAFDRWIGLQHDAWGGLKYNYDSPREIEAIYRSFFFNGAKFHDAEFNPLAITQDGKAVFNAKGAAYVKVTRLAAIHPRRGSQRVKIAFMRGSDNFWGWTYPMPRTSQHRSLDWVDPGDPKEYVDFDLLNVAFPKFGDGATLNPSRWLTGTPQGPCDMLPHDTPAGSLKRYDAIVMLGANKMEADQWNRYTEFVRGGGTLVLGLYQLLSPSRDKVYFRQDVSDLLGVRLGKDEAWWDAPEKQDYTFFTSQHYNKVEMAGAEVVARLPNGDALLTRHRVGKGWAYFFTTDRLSTVSGEAQKLIESIFAASRPVEMSPASDWMEVAVSQKGDLRIVAIMDHGRDCLPTDAGVDTGPYSGAVTLDLDRMGLPAGDYEVLTVATDDKITKLTAAPADFRQTGRKISVNVKNMGSYLELVIGPKGKTEKSFFWD